MQFGEEQILAFLDNILNTNNYSFTTICIIEKYDSDDNIVTRKFLSEKPMKIEYDIKNNLDDEPLYDIVSFTPIIIQQPVVNHSLNISSKKFKINNASIIVNDFKYKNKYFSDDLKSLYGAELSLYFVDDSIEHIEDAYPSGGYTFTITEFTQDENQIVIQLDY